MRECEQLKHALGVSPDSRKPRATTTTTRMAASISTTGTVNLIDVISAIADPILAMTTGIDVIIIATITAMTTVAMTKMTGVTTTGMIIVTTSVTTVEKIGVMIDVVKTTTIAMTTIGKSELHHHRLKGETPMVRSSQPTEKSTSSLEVAKQPKATDRSDQMQGRSGTSILRPRNLCIGLSSQSLSPGKIIGSTSPTRDIPASR
jgi:hypothetical protein